MKADILIFPYFTANSYHPSAINFLLSVLRCKLLSFKH